MPTATPPVAIIMGSRSDWPTMKKAADALDALGVAYEAKVVSAHRTPQRLVEFSTTAQAAGYKVIIAGAGGAAHLPGMVASMTILPVLGVPVQSKALNGLDSLLSIVQMPGGIPSPPWRSARRAPRTPACWPPRSWRSRTPPWPSAWPPSGPNRPTASSKALKTDDRSRPPLPPGSTIGILGGGQLGRMLALAAARLGFDVVILDPEENSPAGRVASRQIVGPYDDRWALRAWPRPATSSPTSSRTCRPPRSPS
jgi:5-(carboxyamino)imidazole ribonucleotide mutase